ncbi:MAG: M1 family metallopeptidase [bacterium]|nr:M1 family metallopeptidase [bacterium]
MAISKTNKKSVRLSGNVVPERYAIKLKPDLQKFTFEGEETISISIQKPTKSVTLHSRELDIEVVEIVSLNRQKSVGQERKFFAIKISYNEKAETATFTFAAPIPRGAARLRLVFRGVLNDKLRGFYRSQYEVAGEKRHMATTQFESTDARRAFPCFDEPAHKAVFDVTLLVPTHTVAISNTLPVSEIEREDGLREVTFSPTPKMSTYLLAFIIGEFEHIETRTKEGTLVRVFVTPGKKHQAEFALECAAKTLSFYNDYFDIPYPLPVLDMIAIPDFSAGAMENWGAITYRETAILVDPKHSSTASKQYVALVIAHEIAHQWFGNLVTMEWWTHLWLNEGFASYIEYLAVDKLYPSWNIWTQFAYMDLSRALALDALKHTHPIEIPVHHPDEIAEIFDEVSYSKGASVIRMLADYLGEKDFRDGLRMYLKKHSYANASTIHLWQAFAKVSGKPVEKIMKNWTGKGGYPVVSANLKNGKLELTQKRFFSNPESSKQVKDKTLWSVPISVLEGAHRQGVLLEKGRALATLRSKDWLKINSGESGFFRTAYSPELLEKLREPLRAGKLSELDRLGLVRDAFALAEGGVTETAEALKLATDYRGEDSYTVWAEMSLHLRKVFNLIADSCVAESYKKFACGIFEKAVKKVSWSPQKGENQNQTLLRSLILGNAGDYSHVETIAAAKKLFTDFLEHGKEVPADLRGAVYGVAAEHLGEKEFDKVMMFYKKETLHEEQGRLGRALASFADKKLLSHVLEFSLSKDVRSQDTLSLVAGVWSNPVGRDLAWSFVKKNWPIFLERYGSGGYSLSRLVKSGSVFHTREQYDDFKQFFKTHSAPGASRAVEQVLEKIDGNIRWLARDGKNIEKWLSNITWTK